VAFGAYPQYGAWLPREYRCNGSGSRQRGGVMEECELFKHIEEAKTKATASNGRKQTR